MEIRNAPDDVDLTDATLIVGMLSENEPAPGAEEAYANADPSLLDLAKFEGKMGQTLTLPHSEAKSVVFVGLGDEAS
jgi:Cytosol aminopeptidase family, N-terminal domain